MWNATSCIWGQFHILVNSMFSRKTSEKTLHHCPLKGQKHSTMKPWWWVGIVRNFSQGFMMAQIPGGRIYCLLTAEGHNVDRKIVTPCLPSFKKLYNCSWELFHNVAKFGWNHLSKIGTLLNYVVKVINCAWAIGAYRKWACIFNLKYFACRLFGCLKHKQ